MTYSGTFLCKMCVRAVSETRKLNKFAWHSSLGDTCTPLGAPPYKCTPCTPLVYAYVRCHLKALISLRRCSWFAAWTNASVVSTDGGTDNVIAPTTKPPATEPSTTTDEEQTYRTIASTDLSIHTSPDATSPYVNER